MGKRRKKEDVFGKVEQVTSSQVFSGDPIEATL